MNLLFSIFSSWERIALAFLGVAVIFVGIGIKGRDLKISNLKQELNTSKIQISNLQLKLETQNAALLKIQLDEKAAKESYEKNLKLIKDKYKVVYKNVIVYRDGNCTQKLELLERTIGDYVK